MAPLPRPSGRTKSSLLPSAYPSSPLVVLAILLATTVPSYTRPGDIVGAEALELPAPHQTALGGRKLLQNEGAAVVQDYTAYCTPQRSTSPLNPNCNTGNCLNPVFDQGDQVVAILIDICNSAVYTVGGQPFKIPAKISGTVTQYPLSDGRRIRVIIDASNVLALPQVYTSDRKSSFFLIGLNPFSPLTGSGTTADFLKVIALGTVHFDLNFELHDGGKPGDPFTTSLSNAVGAPFGISPYDPLVTPIELAVTVSTTGPLRRTPPLFPIGTQFPVGNPAVITGTERLIHDPTPDGTTIKSFDLNILPPDDGSALQTMEYLARSLDPSILLTGITPTAGPASSNPPTPAPTTDPLTPAGRASVNGKCDASGDSPNECFSASGKTSVCCPRQCPNPPFEPAACTGPATSSTTPTDQCNPQSAKPNRCFNANGSEFVCCPGSCAPGEPGAKAACAN